MNISIKNLTKSYRKKQVLHNIHCDIGPYIYGLLGPNGSGKTTFIRCLLNITDYQGNISFNKDKDIQVGYLPQVFDVFTDLNVYEQLEYFALLKNISNREYEINRVLDLIHMAEYKNVRCNKLSGGMIRRLGIAQALLGKPDLIILDEPTVGLDLSERNHFIEVLSQLNLDIPIILSTHIIEDIEKLCSHVLFLDEGHLLYQGNINELYLSLKDKIYTVNIQDLFNVEEQYLKLSQINHQVRVYFDKKNKPDCFKKTECEFEDLYYYILKHYEINHVQCKE